MTLALRKSSMMSLLLQKVLLNLGRPFRPILDRCLFFPFQIFHLLILFTTKQFLEVDNEVILDLILLEPILH
jgi:hypothetical protein